MKSKFWMVYVEGTQGTSKQHLKEGLANKEAERLFFKYNCQRPVHILQLKKNFKERGRTMNRLELKFLLSLFLFATFLVLIIFLLVIPLNWLFIFLIFPSIPLSFFIVNCLDKLLTHTRKERFLAIVMGIITLLILLIFFFFVTPFSPNTIYLGVLYDGTSHVTTEQYNAIKYLDGLNAQDIYGETYTYNGQESFSVTIVNSNPLTITYHLYSHKELPFLIKSDTDWISAMPKQSDTTQRACLVIPLFLIIIGVAELYPSKKTLLLINKKG